MFNSPGRFPADCTRPAGWITFRSARGERLRSHFSTKAVNLDFGQSGFVRMVQSVIHTIPICVHKSLRATVAMAGEPTACRHPFRIRRLIW